MDVEWVLVYVGSISTYSDTGGGCQIAAVSAHSLNHKHSPLGPRGRLLDLVTALKKNLKLQYEMEIVEVALNEALCQLYRDAKLSRCELPEKM